NSAARRGSLTPTPHADQLRTPDFQTRSPHPRSHPRQHAPSPFRGATPKYDHGPAPPNPHPGFGPRRSGGRAGSGVPTRGTTTGVPHRPGGRLRPAARRGGRAGSGVPTRGTTTGLHHRTGGRLRPAARRGGRAGSGVPTRGTTTGLHHGTGGRL